MPLRAFLLLVFATVAATISSHGATEEKIFEVAGAIRVPLDDNNRIVIAHEAIPGLMPAMTMGFAVAKPAEVASLKTGDRVRFQLCVGAAGWSVANFRIVGRETPPPAAPTPAANASRRRLREGDLVPEFALIAQGGQPFTPAELRGHITVLTFIFTRCPVPEYCPAMALRFAQLQKAILAKAALAGRAQLVSVTLDPEYDRPETLKAYGETVGARPPVWQFATGAKSEIEALAKSFAVFTERNGATLDHTLCTALIDGDGRVLGLWRGNGWRVDEVLAALNRSLPVESLSPGSVR